MHPHEIEDYLQQNPITVPEGKHHSIQASLGNRSLGFLYSTAVEGKTHPTAEVVEVNGQIKFVPIAKPKVGLMRYKHIMTNNRFICVGSQQLQVTPDELESLTDILIKRRESAVKIKSGHCVCVCGTKCPLGRTDSNIRCTETELKASGIPVKYV